MKNITYTVSEAIINLGHNTAGLAYYTGDDIMIFIDINAANKSELKVKLLEKITLSDTVAIIQKNARY